MLVPIDHRRHRFQKVHMPIAHFDRTAGPAAEFVEMVLVEVGSEPHLMHMVAAANQNGLSGYRRESVVMRIFAFLSDLNAAEHFMDMPLLMAIIVP